MRITEGGCFCGSIRYRITGEPAYSVICHCNSCRRAAGAPSVAWITVDRRQLKILSGELRQRRSSPRSTRHFCGACGCPLAYETADAPHSIDLTTLSLDDPGVFPPTAEVWVGERLGWQPANRALGQYPRDLAAGLEAGD